MLGVRLSIDGYQVHHSRESADYDPQVVVLPDLREWSAEIHGYGLPQVGRLGKVVEKSHRLLVVRFGRGTDTTGAAEGLDSSVEVGKPVPSPELLRRSFGGFVT